jgi:hypothetical protein
MILVLKLLNDLNLDFLYYFVLNKVLVIYPLVLSHFNLIVILILEFLFVIEA